MSTNEQSDLWGAPLGAFKAKRKDPKPRGHVSPPGTGPAGETCGSCRHAVRFDYSKSFYKCALAKARWTCGRGTDVRARDAACSRWEKNL